MIYNLYKTNINNEKLLKESLFNISRFVEAILKKLITFVITFNLLIAIKKKYKSDNII